MSRGGKRPGAGRPKGSTAERADRIRSMILDAIDWEQIPNDLEQVTPRERLRFIASILNKVLPRPLTEELCKDEHIKFVVQTVSGVKMPLVEEG